MRYIFTKHTYFKATLGPPCLSLDVIPDELGNDLTTYPLTLYGVAGTQTQKTTSNSIIVFKMHNLHETKRRSKKSDDSDGDDSEDEEDENNPEKQPKLKVAGIKHTEGKLLIPYHRLLQQVLSAKNIILRIIKLIPLIKRPLNSKRVERITERIEYNRKEQTPQEEDEQRQTHRKIG